jgi:hypothetical protein
MVSEKLRLRFQLRRVKSQWMAVRRASSMRRGAARSWVHPVAVWTSDLDSI